MPLDVLSERGLETVAQENRAIEIFEACYMHSRFVRTPKDSAASLDGMLLKRGELVAVAECKCRTMSHETLMREYGGEWLLSWEKIDAGLSAHALLNVGMFGLLYLVPDDLVLLVRIIDDNGRIVAPMRIAATETQRTVNGGTAIRNNAYINVSGARVLTMPRIIGQVA